MSLSLRTTLVLTLAAVACAPHSTQPSTTPQPQQAPAGMAAAGAQSSGGPQRGGLKSFKELTAGAVAHTGFLDTYEKPDGHLYMAVRPEQLGRDFLMNFEIAQGIGARGIYGGTMLNIFEGSLVALERHGDRIFLVQRPHRFTADPGSPMEKAVELSFGSSILESAKIEAMRDDSAAVIDVQDWFVSDLSDIGSVVRGAVASRPGQPGRATLDKTRSYLASVKAFPDNVDLQAQLTFTPGEPVNINSVADSRFIPVAIHYNLVRLPEQPMTPRVADDRMGYFLTVRKDFSGDDDEFFARYINRWRLEPGRKVGSLYEPVHPIVYYLDPNIPVEYRPYVKAGVEAWNRAFEAAGFTNAIRAEMLPDSADPEDIRYHTLRWNTSDQAGYGAIGPSVVDPRTGEILDADILFEESFIRGFEQSWRTMVSPATAVEMALGTADVDSASLVRAGESPELASVLGGQGVLLRTMLAARGEIKPGAPVPIEFVGQGLKWATMHEVGHTLGLRHNFRASSDTPLDRLHDAQWTTENGLYSSVMDYPSINLAADGKPNGLYYNAGVGSSDLWAISYGYTPDAARAAELARQAAQPGHALGTDEDARGPGALDPTVNVYDLGADPLEWGRNRAQLIRSLLPSLPKRVLTDNARYAELTDALQSLMNQYALAVITGVKYIGGQYQHRDHVGDPGARPPFVPVPRAKQEEALAFLREYAFSEGAFQVPQAVLAQLGANRWAHWGEDNTFNGRIDYPVHEQILGVQRAILSQVMQPFVFARIRDAETKFGRDSVLTIPDLLDGLTASIFSEVLSGRTRAISATRRDLQRAYVDRLSQMAIGNEPRLPADARSVARYQLATLERRIDARRNAAGMDEYSRAHLLELSARIDHVLNATVSAAGVNDRPQQQPQE
ncbi:MAG TPA: zinc-dependent metalloprotease [Gemmatimonadaceae bacterium]|nr:zinc-dependent metalloprotease [Gemmatimonadaceae bacterium]